MSSQIDICNEALSRLGANRIASFDDGTIESIECGARFNIISKQVQSRGPWMSNKLRVQLPQLIKAPTFGFTYAYQLPINPLCLRPLKINEDQVGQVDYQIENNLLLCNEPSVSILYIGLLTDTTQFDPYLEESIVDFLVAGMTKKFTGSMQEVGINTKYALENQQRLLTLSSLSGSADVVPSAIFIDVRNFGNGMSDEGTSISDQTGTVGFNILSNDSHNNGIG